MFLHGRKFEKIIFPALFAVIELKNLHFSAKKKIKSANMDD
jgi:hypothetical protein